MHEESALILARLAQDLNASQDPADAAGRVTAIACEFFGADHAVVTIRRARHRYQSLGTSDVVAERVEDSQHDLREGPAVDTMVSGDVTVEHQLSATRRWPQWRAKVSDEQIESVLSYPIGGRGRDLGALTLYSSARSRFVDVDTATLEAFAQSAGRVLAAEWEIATLMEAMESRSVVARAQGVLMGRHGLDADAAFSTLRRYSQSLNVPLVKIARDYLETGNLPKG